MERGNKYFCIMRKKQFILSAILILCSLGMQAQDVYTSSGRTVKQSKKLQREKEKGFDANRIVFGGGLGLGFGTITSIAVAPVVGYRITDNFAAGVSIGYQYMSIKDYWKMPIPNSRPASFEYHPYRSSIYSGGVWARYVIWRNIFVHTEYEHNFMSFRRYYQEWDYQANGIQNRHENVKYNAPALLVGGGFRQPLNDRVSFIVMGLYDVIQDQYSPYRNRLDLRIGVNVGF